MSQQLRFVTVEGGEGVGKSTFCTLLRERLAGMGWDVFQTREPGGTAIAQRIREIFLAPPGGETLSGLTELFLVSAARAQHVFGPIATTLSKPKGLVLCDRFHDSTRVYQGILGGNKSADIENLIATSIGTYEPTITFLLDCDLAVSQQRLAERARVSSESPSRFDAESEAFHQKLREAYLTIRQKFPQRITILDAQKNPTMLVDEALEILQSRGLLDDN